jgi:hypothetical protein
MTGRLETGDLTCRLQTFETLRGGQSYVLGMMSNSSSLSLSKTFPSDVVICRIDHPHLALILMGLDLLRFEALDVEENNP